MDQAQTYNWSCGRESTAAACGHPDSVFENQVEELHKQLPFGVDSGPTENRTTGSVPAVEMAGSGRIADAGPKEPLSERFVEGHLPMVRFIAWRIHERLPKGVPIDDLIGAGILGLMDAYLKYDPGRGVQFKTYAQFRVRGAILDSLRSLDWRTRGLRAEGRKIESHIHALSQKLGRMPESTEIAESLGISLPGYHKLVTELSNLSEESWGEQSTEEEEGMVENLPADPGDSPFERCLQGELRQRLDDAIVQLPARERLVVSLFYYEEMPAREIAACIGVAPSRVSQIRHAAVLRLRSEILSGKTHANPNRRL